MVRGFPSLKFRRSSENFSFEYLPKLVFSNFGSFGSFNNGFNSSPLLYTNLIAPAVYFVFPPAKYSLAFSKIFTVAPFSSAEIPAHKAALPDPTIISFLDIIFILNYFE